MTGCHRGSGRGYAYIFYYTSIISRANTAHVFFGEQTTIVLYCCWLQQSLLEVASLELRHEGVYNILFFYHLVLGFVFLVVGPDMRVLTVTFVSPASSPLLVLGGRTKNRGLEMRLQEEW